MVIWFTSFAPKGGLTVSSESYARQQPAAGALAVFPSSGDNRDRGGASLAALLLASDRVAPSASAGNLGETAFRVDGGATRTV